MDLLSLKITKTNDYKVSKIFRTLCYPGSIITTYFQIWYSMT